MTNQQHPITPPPELVREWCLHSSEHETYDQFWRHIATQAAQWGADQELEVCCEWLFENDYDVAPVCLRAARRPKPPSLKEQALEQLKHVEVMANYGPAFKGVDLIRRALEALDD